MLDLERLANQIAENMDRLIETEGVSEERPGKKEDIESGPIPSGSGVYPSQLIDIAADAVRNNSSFNCYPGEPGAPCHDLAIFFSLQGPFAKNHGRRIIGHLSFEEALQKIVQHMSGYCHGKTKAALFFADTWDADAFEKWRWNLLQIRKQCHFIMVMWTAGRVSRIL